MTRSKFLDQLCLIYMFYCADLFRKSFVTHVMYGIRPSLVKRIPHKIFPITNERDVKIFKKFYIGTKLIILLKMKKVYK